MKKIAANILSFSLLLSVLYGCVDDEVDAPDKGEVDRTALEDGLTVKLSGTLGTVTVPMSVPVPDAEDSTLKEEFSSAVSLVLKNADTGATVNLMSGSMVDGTPTGAGKFAVALNSDRDEVTVTFYNEASEGQSLRTTGDYAGTLAIFTNDYVSSLGSTAVDVSVQ